MKIPITIGTIPITDNPTTQIDPLMNEYNMNGARGIIATTPDTPTSNIPTAPAFDNSDPPTYEEATRPNAYVDGTAFLPKYPMFKRATSYSN